METQEEVNQRDKEKNIIYGKGVKKSNEEVEVVAGLVTNAQEKRNSTRQT